jgi:hypothetical protein
VVLPVTGRDGATLTVTAPPDRAVAPAGPYLLFANRATDGGPVPSIGRQVFVGTPLPTALAAQLPETAPGQATPPLRGHAPEQVLVADLADALGAEAVPVPTRLASARDGVRHLPGWLGGAGRGPRRAGVGRHGAGRGRA